jgi:hypothetical protein
MMENQQKSAEEHINELIKEHGELLEKVFNVSSQKAELIKTEKALTKRINEIRAGINFAQLGAKALHEKQQADTRAQDEAAAAQAAHAADLEALKTEVPPATLDLKV